MGFCPLYLILQTLLYNYNKLFIASLMMTLSHTFDKSSKFNQIFIDFNLLSVFKL